MISIIKTLFPLRRTAFFAIILVLLAILFSQLAFSKDLDISGKMFLDMNSNGKFDASDLPLPGYTIYIDANDNSIFDPGESNCTTSANGSYSFTKVPLVGSVSEWVLPGYSFQPSSPSLGFSYNLSNANELFKDRLDFGNIPRAAQNNNSSMRDLLLSFIFTFALIIVVLGLFVLFDGLSKLEGITKDSLIDNNAILRIVFGFILLFFGLYLWMALWQQSGNTMSVAVLGTSVSFSIVLPIILALLVFGAVLLMLYAHYRMRTSEPGEMRKTIAGLLVLGLVAIVFVALTGTSLKENKDIITQYIELVGIVVAFYFGSKAASDAYKQPEEVGNAQDDLDIESVTYDKETGEIEIVVRNRKLLNFEVEKVAITDGKNFNINNDMERKPSNGANKFPLNLKFIGDDKTNLERELQDPEKKYTITIKTISIGPKIISRTIPLKGAGKDNVCPPVAEDASGATTNMDEAKNALVEATEAMNNAKDALTSKPQDLEKAKNALVKATTAMNKAKSALNKATTDNIKGDKTELEKAASSIDDAKTALDAIPSESQDVKTAKETLYAAIEGMKSAKKALDEAIKAMVPK